MTIDECPTCRNGLWHVGHVCYTDADLAERRAKAAEERELQAYLAADA